MANYPFASVDDFRDVESVNHFGTAMVAGEDPAGAGGDAPDEPRQRAHPGAVGRAPSTPASPPGRRGCR